MAFKVRKCASSQIQTLTKTKLNLKSSLQFSCSISSLKVPWRKDPSLDQAIASDKHYKLCFRVVRQVLDQPGQAIPVRYLDARRERMRLPITMQTFLNHFPLFFDLYRDRIKPDKVPVPFVRPSLRLRMYLDDEIRIYRQNEMFIVAKLCKLLMMAKHKVICAHKLVDVKRVFGFPNDFLVNLVPKYPQYFRLVGSDRGEGKLFLELVSWNDEFAKSVIQLRAEEESRLIGIGVRPNFNVLLPKGCVLKKEMREWVRDWLELQYMSPYDDASNLEQASREMEKRRVGVFHELLSLSLLKRIPVPTLGKFSEEYGFSNEFSTAFTRHSGIFYMSRKGEINTAVLREAYKGEELIDRDPLLAIKDKFAELVDECLQERKEKMRSHNEWINKEREMVAVRTREMMAVRIKDLDEPECDEDTSSL